MAVKAGCFVNGMAMSEDATQWQMYLTISTSGLNGTPRSAGSELMINVADNESQNRSALIAHTKAFATATWGITFGGGDTAQVWLSNRVEG